MAEITENSVLNSDIRRAVKGNHKKLLGLFLIYLGSPADSRQTLAEQILHQLGGHLAMVEAGLFPEIRKLGTQGQTIVENAELQHEELKAMIVTWQQAEGDDDQEWDEFFEDMMQTVRMQFVTEERDLLPLFDRLGGDQPTYSPRYN